MKECTDCHNPLHEGSKKKFCDTCLKEHERAQHRAKWRKERKAAHKPEKMGCSADLRCWSGTSALTAAGRRLITVARRVLLLGVKGMECI